MCESKRERETKKEKKDSDFSNYVYPCTRFVGVLMGKTKDGFFIGVLA